MLDSDLARLYECANGTKSINLAVKRHINRFPERFMFQLTKEEFFYLRFNLKLQVRIIMVVFECCHMHCRPKIIYNKVLRSQVRTINGKYRKQN